MVEAQFEGLNMATECVKAEFPLTTSFIRELHALITRAQAVYDATDALGRPVQTRLTHGKFKTLPNNVAGRPITCGIRSTRTSGRQDGETRRVAQRHG